MTAPHLHHCKPGKLAITTGLCEREFGHKPMVLDLFDGVANINLAFVIRVQVSDCCCLTCVIIGENKLIEGRRNV